MSYECDRCDRCFNSSAARWQHQDAKNHFAFECRCCNETYPSYDDRVEHEDDDHNYHHCDDCDRGFNAYNSLQNHLRSRIHVGANIDCPFCGRGFATATGVAHHIEQSACPSARSANRETIYRTLRGLDPNGNFSKKLLTWDGEMDDPPELASDYAWNGNCYECYLCHRGFNSLPGLNQHLQSPVHMQNLYHCPNRACQRDFKTVAALVNHFESESCGFMRFSQVQQGINGMITGRRLLGQ